MKKTSLTDYAEQSVIVKEQAVNSHTESSIIATSPTVNECSVPKDYVHIENSSQPENDGAPLTLEQRQEKCKSDLLNLPSQALKHVYEREYKTWSNCKFRAKDLKDISGPVWSSELNTFPGFLAHVGPKPNLKYSMDRIDPKFGYVLGNLRWASAQLQSENRKNVQVHMVDGMPMNLHQIAEHFGTTYDALRMRLQRGADLKALITQYEKGVMFSGDKGAVDMAKKVEACPWPPGKEKDWEACYLAERTTLLHAKEQGSRTAFFVAKCTKQWWHFNSLMVAEVEDNGVISTPYFEVKMRYWELLVEYARGQREIVTKALSPFMYSIEPTVNELTDIEKLYGPIFQGDDETKN